MYGKIKGVTAAALFALAASVSTAHGAGNNIVLSGITGAQSTFDGFVDEIGMAIAYNPFSPAEPLGITGFEIGVSVSMVELDKTIWNQVVSDGAAPSTLPVPRLMARKGLPWGIDIGAAYTSVPGSNVKIVGGEIRKAILEGSTVTPAVSIIGHFSNLSGVDDLDLSTYGVDVGVSKGFAMFTPYAAAGVVSYEGKAGPAFGLNPRDNNETRSYVGLRFGFMPLMNLVAQADFAKVNSYTIRLNIGF